jgi:ABC-type Mn2+/Zn2+ transport system permease subunit
MLVQRWLARLIVGGAIASAASLLGLFASYRLDLPTGAAIVCACGLLLILVGMVGVVRRGAIAA